MTLVLDNLSNDGLLELLVKLPINEELYAMTFGELEAVNNSIDKIVHIYHDDDKLCEKLIRIKSLTSLIEEYAKKKR